MLTPVEGGLFLYPDRAAGVGEPFNEAMPRFLTEFCFGDFYTRSGLALAERELLEGAADFDLELIESRTLDGHIQELIYRPTLH